MGSTYEFLSDFICPNCYDDKHKMLYTKCGHRFCDQCKTNMFTSRGGNVIFCPFCNETLKRSDISEKSNEEKDFEAEMGVRNKLKNQYNETLENFETEKEYNDYLENYEVIVKLK